MKLINTLEDAKNRYGIISDNKWENESNWMVMFSIPDNIHIINQITKKKQNRIYLNKDIVIPLTNVLNDLILNNLHHELKTFSGCFIIRDVRGFPGKPSTHSYGLALDFRADEMLLGSNSLFSDEFINIWKKHGWTCGADFKRKDPQHFSYAWE